jgi:catechol 2,3-dioxygenase-like lactoylglutathione lyase family enzyme
MKKRLALLAGLIAASFGLAAAAAPPSAEDKAREWGPIIPGAHFHHMHLNVVDREAAIAFYTSHFDARRAKWDGQDAVWTQRSWFLFNEVKTPPPTNAGTAINHFGWGAPDARAEFERQKGLRTTFQTEIRDISTGLGGKAGQFFFMYVKGPNGETIELNTDPDNNFGHIHMDSADPLGANAWYRNMFGAVDAPPYFPDLVTMVGAGRTSRQFLDNINIIINGRTNGPPIRSTKGAIVDHIGISVPNLDKAMAAVRAHKVTVLEEPSPGPGKHDRHAFIEGPDKIVIELVEDHTPHPPVTD